MAEAWACMNRETVAGLFFTGEDNRLMEKFAGRLGQGSEAEEEELFRYMLAQLNIQQEQAQQKLAAEERLWQYGGFMAGILVVLVCL